MYRPQFIESENMDILGFELIQDEEDRIKYIKKFL